MIAATYSLHSIPDPLDPDAMAQAKNHDPSKQVHDTHAPVSDAEALDLLADWLRRAPGRRKVIEAQHHADGTFTFRLEHEHGSSGSYTQRTLSGAIRSAIGVAITVGAR